jgi:hypothetical protein
MGRDSRGQQGEQTYRVRDDPRGDDGGGRGRDRVRRREQDSAGGFAVAVAEGGIDAFTPPPAWVMKYAAKQAVIGGDAHPAYAGWTLATVAEIAPALGERVSDIPASSRDKQMYLVVLHGNFTTLTFTHPMGYTQPPVIHWVQFELDPTTHGVVVWGWTHKGPPPPVEKLLHPFRL